MDITNRLEELETEIQSVKQQMIFQTKKTESLNTTRLDTPLNSIEQAAIKSLVKYPVTINLQGTSAATATNYGIFFIAENPVRLVAVSEVHTTLGTDLGAVTLQIEKLTGTTAPDSGTALLSTAFNLKGTINTVQYGVLVPSVATILQKGDRLCLKDVGTLTAVAGVNVTVWINPI